MLSSFANAFQRYMEMDLNSIQSAVIFFYQQIYDILSFYHYTGPIILKILSLILKAQGTQFQ